jgi:predicted O-methyltransferase YrrM
MRSSRTGRGVEIARRGAASVREHGVRATLLAAGAKRRGAKQKLGEFAGLVALVMKRRPRTVVEIGTLHGGTLWAWSRAAASGAMIVSIDLPGGRFGGGYRAELSTSLRRFARRGQRIELIRGDSHDPSTLAQAREVLRDRRVDFLFIDGDHSYEGVRTDFELYRQLLADDGLVAFHDVIPNPRYLDSEVDLLWRELVAAGHRHVEFVDRTGQTGHGDWGGIGVLWGPTV